MGAINKKVCLSLKNEMTMLIIQIPESSARNILTKHFDKISKSRGWINALIFFIPFTLTYFTSDFKGRNIFGWVVSSDQVSAFFFFCWIAALFYLIYTIINSARHKDSVENIISDLINNKEC